MNNNKISFIATMMVVLALTVIIESIAMEMQYVHADCKFLCGQIILGNGNGNGGDGGNNPSPDDGNNSSPDDGGDGN
jgi:hypothetical protein